jgi:hypothetical protein
MQMSAHSPPTLELIYLRPNDDNKNITLIPYFAALTIDIHTLIVCTAVDGILSMPPLLLLPFFPRENTPFFFFFSFLPL